VKWVFAAGLALFLMLAALLVFSDFADVPCQDGTWNSAKQRCVPT
jgi:hypothetical protein